MKPQISLAAFENMMDSVPEPWALNNKMPLLLPGPGCRMHCAASRLTLALKFGRIQFLGSLYRLRSPGLIVRRGR